MTGWLQFQDVDLETLRYLIQLVREHYEQFGSWPTPEQIRVSLGRP